jgi:hypothetical protein
MIYSITITGDKEVIKKMDSIDKALLNPREPLTEFAQTYMPQIDANIQSEGRLFEKPWPKILPRTIQKKVKAGFSSEVMTETGKLRKSFGYQVRTQGLSQAIGGYIRTGLLTIYCNPAVLYFRYQQLGTSRIPQRMMLRLTDSHRASLLSITINWIKKIIRSGGK